MADTRYLKQRRQGWYFQLAVPARHREALGGTIIVSLKTRDLTVAQTLRWAKLIKAQEAFAKLDGRRPAPEPVDPEALLQIDEFALTTYREALAKMAADARKGVRAWGKPELDVLYDDLSIRYINNDFAPVAQPLADYCERNAIAPRSEIYERLGEALLLARMRAVWGRKDGLDNKPSEEPTTFLERQPIDLVPLKPLRASSSARGGLIFAKVAAHFIAERQRDPSSALTEQSIGQYQTTFRLFDSWANQPKLEEVDQRKASNFIDAIAALDPKWGRGKGVKGLSFAEIVERYGGHKPGLSTVTINRHAIALSLVWKHAEKRDGYEGKNPWQAQMRPTAKHRGNSGLGKRAFTASEIGKLLEHRPLLKVSAHDYATALPWVVLIGAYSGMRLNEICELAIEDVKESAEIFYFDLTASKSEAGVRIVPVHSTILEAGILKYRDGVGEGSLWPGIKPGGPDKKRRWYVTKRFTEFRRRLKLIDIDKVTGRDRLDFHSLRRSAVTALNHARIPEHEVAEIVGHKHPRVTFGVYADRQQLSRLQTIVEAIQYNY